MHSLRLEQINSIQDLNALRILRNECREFMTRYKEIISYNQQVEWYSKLDLSKNILFLLKRENTPVGYGYIRSDNKEVLLTGGLCSIERDKGYGKVLFSLLVEKSKSFQLPIRLEVLKNNNRAFSLYRRLGFDILREDNYNIYMEIK